MKNDISHFSFLISHLIRVSLGLDNYFRFRRPFVCGAGTLPAVRGNTGFFFAGGVLCRRCFRFSPGDRVRAGVSWNPFDRDSGAGLATLYDLAAHADWSPDAFGAGR